MSLAPRMTANALRTHSSTLGGLTWVGLTVLALITGLISASGSPLLIAFIGGVACLAILLTIPLRAIIQLLFAVTFIAVGLIGYFGSLNQVYWLPYLICLFLYIYVGINAFSTKREGYGNTGYSVSWLIASFILLLLVSSLVNQLSLLQAAIALKNYLFFWSLFILLAFAGKNERLFEQIWKGLFWVAAIQLPIAIAQYARAGAHGWDAVSGSFGGSETGGQSGVLGLFMVIAITLIVALRQAKLVSYRRALFFTGLFMAPLIAAEVKAAVVIFLPVAMALLNFNRFKKNPFKFLGGAAFVAIAIFGVLSLYQVFHYSQAGPGTDRRTTMEKLSDTIEMETGATYIRASTGEMGRIAILVFWWRKHSVDNLPPVLVGHGPGSLRTSSLYQGEIAAKFNKFKMDRHAAAFLLWDLGIAGLGLYVAILLIGIRYSLLASRCEDIPLLHRVYLRVGTVALSLLALSVFYMRAAIDSPAGLALVMLCLAQAVYWKSRVSPDGQKLVLARNRSAFGPASQIARGMPVGKP